MGKSTLGTIMQKTFAKSVTGSAIALDGCGDYWWNEISSVPPGFVSSNENSRVMIHDWKNSKH